MVDIVTALPPSDGQSTAKVGDEEPDQGVDPEDVRNGTMAGIVRGEHELVPEETQKDG